ncbi:MAG: hypothetical protein OXN17_18835 [Candidatus Poribacteria bacterium]|nr:hypothetical protein [Candidatus Poribacteria bacterium]MDE0504011.1 hypothetical protein [Candidatus Poribacteria bacterium]
MPNISDDPQLLRVSLIGLLSAVVFMCLYLQEKRTAPEQRTPPGGFVTFLLYIFPIAFVIGACMGVAVTLDTGDPRNLLPVFTSGLTVAAVLLWGRAKKVR